jgi:hypothetical protein
MLLSSHRREFKLKLKVAGIAIALILLAACSAAAPQQQPPGPENPYAALPDAARTYLAQVYRFDSMDAVAAARDRSASDLRLVVDELQMIVAPPDLQQAHEELIAGYQFALQGREILESTTDNVERAEGMFLGDWGMMHLQQHIELVSAYINSIASASTP